MTRNGILGFAIGPIGAGLLGLLALPASTWLFDVADIGRLGLLQTLTSLSVILCGMGLDQSYAREYHQTHDHGALFRTAVAPGLLLIVAVGTVISLMAPTMISRSIFQLDSWKVGAIVVVVVIAAYCSRFLSLILRMEERGVAFSMSQLLPRIFFLMALLAIYLVQVDRQFIHLLLAHAIAVMAATLIFAWNSRATWLSPGRTGRQPPSLQGMLGFGAPLMVAGVASWGMEAMDKISLRVLATFEDLGIYSIAVSIAGVATTLSVIFSTVWIPTAYRWAVEPDAAMRIEGVGHRLTALAAALIAATGAFSWLLGLVLPAHYEDVQYLVCACMLPPILYAIAEVAGIGTSIARRNAPIMIGSLIACAVNLVGNYLLIPQIGVRGAAISTVIAFVLMMVIRIEAAILYWHPIKRATIYIPVAGMVAFSCAYAMTGHAHPTAWIVVWMLLLVATSYGYRRPLADFMASVVPGRRDGADTNTA